MYDKLTLWLGRECYNNVFPSFTQDLVDAKTSEYHQTGKRSILGSLGNFKVNVSDDGILMNGSLAKFFYDGSNVLTLDKETTSQAIEKLCDATRLNFNQAKVTSLEFGDNFLMRHNVSAYFSILGDLDRMTRLLTAKSTLTYKSKRKELVFYDKIAEAKAKKMPYSEGLSFENLLRYELKLKKDLKSQLKESEILVSLLADTRFYNKLVGLYKTAYFTIRKLAGSLIYSANQINTPSEAMDTLFASFLSEISPEFIGGFIDGLKSHPIGKNKQNLHRAKKLLYQKFTKAQSEYIIDANVLAKELEDCIRDCVAYW